MCDPRICAKFETFNPEIEYQKLLKRRPVVSTKNFFEPFHKRDKIKCPYVWKGYGIERDINIMYRTTSNEYGYYAPSEFTIPTRYFPLTQYFTNELARCGMYRNFGLNTNMDRKKD